VTAAPTPMSAELLAYALQCHPCDSTVHRAWCPCRRAWAGVCSECGAVLFLATRDWCPHAAEVWEAYG
jgi:hypothetical protein